MAVSAVPGSGKTTTLAALAARLIERGLPDDGYVLVVTYQNAAVENFRAQIGRHLTELNQPRIGYEVRTLHSLAYHIVQQNPGLAGTTSGFDVLDERQTGHLLEIGVHAWLNAHHELWESLRPDDWTPRNWQSRWDYSARETARLIVRTAKNCRVSPKEIAERLAQRQTDPPLHVGEIFLRMGVDVYTLYQQQLETLGVLDFDDLIRIAVDMLNEHEDYRDRLRRRWPFILEDEAQDSVPLQEQLLSLLAGSDGNWVRVGDPNQAIMSTFTASDPRSFRVFIHRPDVQRLSLPVSGRSGRPIIRLANRLVDWAVHEHPIPEIRRRAFLPLHIEPAPPGDPQPNPSDEESAVDMPIYRHISEELATIARRAAQRARSYPEQTLAILTRDNSTGQKMVDHLRALGDDVPFDDLLRGSARSRDVAQVIHAVLSVLVSPLSWRPRAEAFEQLAEIEYPGLNIGENPARVTILLRSCPSPEQVIFPVEGTDWRDGFAPVPDLSETDWEAVGAFVAFLRRAFRARTLPVDELVMTLAQDLFPHPSDLATAQKLASYLRAVAENSPGRRLAELTDELRLIAQGRARFLGPEETWQGFTPRPGVITVTTMHRAKGLEWDTVYLVGVDDFWFPGDLDADFIGTYPELGGSPTEEAKARLEAALNVRPAGADPDPTREAKLATIAESLRLLYVAITRARRNLCISWSQVIVARGNREVSRALAPALRPLRELWQAERET
jgi:DNA helicase-2/ATP-dependent DNA helicase PcrA